ncbi:MAG: hypothetical protein M3T49_08755 [Candidatus Eremiobacteraeota bacterium]|nr:hypothetical protein [Candidatus Eremiobacteraeota bacterium]
MVPRHIHAVLYHCYLCHRFDQAFALLRLQKSRVYAPSVTTQLRLIDRNLADSGVQLAVVLLAEQVGRRPLASIAELAARTIRASLRS